MKKIIFLLFAALHFSVIIWSNIMAEEQALSFHFTRKKEGGKVLGLLNKSPLLLKAYDAYAYYTGAGTGYGFYAPSVANQLLIVFTLKDKQHRPVNVLQIPFSNKDAYIRCLNIGNRYLERPEKSDTLENKLLDAMIKSMALWMIDTHPGTHGIEVDLLVYNIAPSFSLLRSAETARYVKKEHYEYSL
jgi:hypothetical protein